MNLSNLKPADGAVQKAGKVVGRGQGSGKGGTATRGHKGAKSRSGYSKKIGFEGGQMPLQRRIPKFGFTNIFKKEFQIVNLGQLEKFTEGETINKDSLIKSGIIKKKRVDLKILGQGEITKPLTVEANAFSKSAIEKITRTGGKVVKI